jgi:plasmid stabilization system protein ParE
VRLEISRRARRQIEKIHAWWTDSRPSARSLFLDELSRAEQLLRTNPEVGIVYIVQRSGAIRRILLIESEYHLYYRYVPSRSEIQIIAIWGAIRGRGPRL